MVALRIIAGLFLFFLNASAVGFDFDAMDDQLIQTGVDKDIVPRDPSWLELKARRAADPVIVALSRYYDQLCKKSACWYLYFKARYVEQRLLIKAYYERLITKA